jgi:hypothetical protein
VLGVEASFALSSSGADKALLESIARGYLQGNAVKFGVQNQIPEIQLAEIHEAPTFYVTRFVQTRNGIRVYNTSAVVMISKEGLRGVDGVTRFKSWSGVVDSKIDSQAALNAATAAISKAVALRGQASVEEVLYVDETPSVHFSSGALASGRAPIVQPPARVAWQVTIPALDPLGDWLVLVDGATGKIILKQNTIVYDTGRGSVYHYGNPIQTGGNLAWPSPDNFDHQVLTDQQFTVQLLDLNPGTGKLSGSYVDLTGCTYYPSPHCLVGYKPAGVADSLSRVYMYTRSNDAFGEVMVYYFVDSLHRYLQQIGEIYLLNYPVPAHAHYFAGANAFYSYYDLGLHFGDYTPNTAEDADVIIHEYGHAIHGDEGLFKGYVSEEMGAFSEGFSDYLTASFLDQGATPQGSLAEWFGYGLRYPQGTYPYSLRDTFSTKHYPEDMTGEVHADGEMWSAALWRLRGLLGKGTADRLAIESGYWLSSWSSFRDAALAMITVDRVVYGGVHESTIRQVFRDNGMLAYWITAESMPDQGIMGRWETSPIGIPFSDRGFENGGGWGSWVPGGAVTPQIVSSPVYSGSYAAELVGSAAGSTTESYIYHAFTMPADATWVRLRFHYRIDTIDTVWYDWFEWRLGTPSNYWGGRWLWNTVDMNGNHIYYDSGDIYLYVNWLQGQSCALTFLLHDDGISSDPTYVYLDGDLSAQYPSYDIGILWSNLQVPITINGATAATPPSISTRVLDGTPVSISTPLQARAGGYTYGFEKWSDGDSNPSHAPFTPTADWYLCAYYTAVTWSGWEKVPGATPSAPTVVYNPYDSREHMFVRGMDGHLWHNSWTWGVTGGWAGWEDMQGSSTDQPAAAVDSYNNMHVVVIGSDGNWWHRMQPPGGAWLAWHKIGSVFTGIFPCLIATMSGRIDLIVRASDRSLRHNYWSSGSWAYDSTGSAWDTNPGGVTPDRPSLAYDSSINVLYVFVRGTDGSIWHRDLTVGGAWDIWRNLPGMVLSSPSVVAASGRLDLLVRGGSNTIWHGYRLYSEAPNIVHWEQLPGATIDAPVEAYRDTLVGTMLEVVVRGTDGGIYHNTLDIQSQTWAPWTQIPGSTPSTPAIMVGLYEDTMYLWVRGTDNGIYFASILFWNGPPP